jgi:bifunctional non-homologous end joining protein LigD
MSLETYHKKRRFNETPEPSGRDPQREPDANALTFCVQRHHASHLHYDLRLECGGTLKSWAVPKGPTLDPADKRLAMMVEDHPIEYGGFEGVIPKGNYGAGSVMLWDRGTYDLLGDATAEEQLARGDFKFHLHGEKINGDFALVRTKRGRGNEWLLLKKKDQFATPGWDPEDHAVSVLTGRTQEEIARQLDPVDLPESPETRPRSGARKSAHGARASASAPKVDSIPKLDPASVPGAQPGSMPKIVSPMLAELGRGTPPSGEDWLYEIKWDGVRAVCFLDHGKVHMLARSGSAIDKQYPELSILPHHIKAGQAILDAEIAALDPQGRPSFELLQRRINVAEASTIARLARANPVTLFAFDLLYLDGYDLRHVPLVHRKTLLKQVLIPGDLIRYSEHFEGHGPEMLEAARQQGLEGVMGKRSQSLYHARRSSDWIKWKVVSSSQFVICGWTEGDREGFGALVLGIYEGGQLRWAGNVGTGFNRKNLASLRAALKRLSAADASLPKHADLPKRVNWVRPELVCEIKFAHWTEDGRLRAPVYLGLRTDLSPEQCVRETGVNPEGSTEAADTSAKPAGNAKFASEPPTKKRPKAESSVADPLLPPAAKELSLDIDGHRLKFTHLDKIFYPAEGYYKRDLLNYYNAVAPLILPHLKDRPLSLKRYPNGIDQPFFFQKNAEGKVPAWVRTEIADGIQSIIGKDRATLLYLVNLGCIDHNPWMSRVGSLDSPDYVLIDLDPMECPYDKIVEAALWVRKRLDKAGLESYPKTTGGDGMHIFVPLEPVYSFDQVRSFAEALATLAAHERPDLFTTPRALQKRDKGKVYFDWMQIGHGKTISAPYVLRAYPGAPVATPLDWSEVTPKLRPEQFHLGNILPRFHRLGDLFLGVLTRPQRLEKAVEKLL